MWYYVQTVIYMHIPIPIPGWKCLDRGWGVLLYGEAPLQSSTPYPFMYHLAEKVPLSYTFYWQMVPLSHTQFTTFHPF